MRGSMVRTHQVSNFYFTLHIWLNRLDSNNFWVYHYGQMVQKCSSNSTALSDPIFANSNYSTQLASSKSPLSLLPTLGSARSTSRNQGFKISSVPISLTTIFIISGINFRHLRSLKEFQSWVSNYPWLPSPRFIFPWRTGGIRTRNYLDSIETIDGGLWQRFFW